MPGTDQLVTGVKLHALHVIEPINQRSEIHREVEKLARQLPQFDIMAQHARQSAPRQPQQSLICIGDISHFRTAAQQAAYTKPVPAGQTIGNTNQLGPKPNRGRKQKT